MRRRTPETSFALAALPFVALLLELEEVSESTGTVPSSGGRDVMSPRPWPRPSAEDIVRVKITGAAGC